MVISLILAQVLTGILRIPFQVIGIIGIVLVPGYFWTNILKMRRNDNFYMIVISIVLSISTLIVLGIVMSLIGIRLSTFHIMIALLIIMFLQLVYIAYNEGIHKKIKG